MDIYILDKTTRTVLDIVDGFESVIWTPRYYEPGDFEIYIKATEKNLSILREDNYVKRYDSDMVGIIESVELTTDVESGDYIIAKGRCVKSLLERRIVWNRTSVKGTVESCIRNLIMENLIAPTLEYRTLPNFVLGDAQEYTETLDAQYLGENLLEIVVALCKAYDYGWKVILNADNDFELQLYKGVDRSFNQTENPFVVFSSTFENIISSNYMFDKSTLRNACNVGGEGEGSSRKFYGVGNASGVDRREMFVDASDISTVTEMSFTFNGNGISKTFNFGRTVDSVESVMVNNREVDSSTYTVNTSSITFTEAPTKRKVIKVTGNFSWTTEEYNNLLIERGREEIANNKATESFEGEVESLRQFVLGRDYNLGDVVSVRNEYGITSNPRIIETIESIDANGRKIIPTFASWEV